MEVTIELSRLTASDWAAWWGAIVATAVLVWDVIKWRRSGPIIRMSVSGNMQTINMGPRFDGQTWIFASVVNGGARPTTLTNFSGVYYRSRLRRLLRLKPDQAFIVTSPEVSKPMPCTLSPGEKWDGVLLQTQQVETWATDGVLYVQVHHSVRQRPVMRRVVLSEKKEANAALEGKPKNAA